jgi:hypothetical protein
MMTIIGGIDGVGVVEAEGDGDSGDSGEGRMII